MQWVGPGVRLPWRGLVARSFFRLSVLVGHIEIGGKRLEPIGILWKVGLLWLLS